MKYNIAVNIIRIKNMKNGITEAQGYIEQFMNTLLTKLKNNPLVTEKDIEELGEIQSLLDWVKNQ